MFKHTILFSLFLVAFHCCSSTVSVEGVRLTLATTEELVQARFAPASKRPQTTDNILVTVEEVTVPATLKELTLPTDESQQADTRAGIHLRTEKDSKRNVYNILCLVGLVVLSFIGLAIFLSVTNGDDNTPIGDGNDNTTKTPAVTNDYGTHNEGTVQFSQ